MKFRHYYVEKFERATYQLCELLLGPFLNHGQAYDAMVEKFGVALTDTEWSRVAPFP